METLDAILTRRSVPKVREEVPPRDVIEKLLEAAIRAPTHHLTQPWRFLVLAGDDRLAIGDAWAAAEGATGEAANKIKAKPLRAPVIIVVIDRPKDHLPKVVKLEEHHSVGAAMQNILLAAHDLGLGAMIRTGAAASYPEVKEVLGVSEGEAIAGFIYVGYPQEAGDRPMTRRDPLDTCVEWRGM